MVVAAQKCTLSTHLAHVACMVHKARMGALERVFCCIVVYSSLVSARKKLRRRVSWLVVGLFRLAKRPASSPARRLQGCASTEGQR